MMGAALRLRASHCILANVGEIDHHSQAIHLGDENMPTRTEAEPERRGNHRGECRDIADHGSVGKGIVTVVRKGRITNA